MTWGVCRLGSRGVALRAGGVDGGVVVAVRGVVHVAGPAVASGELAAVGVRVCSSYSAQILSALECIEELLSFFI